VESTMAKEAPDQRAHHSEKENGGCLRGCSHEKCVTH
jgi:hypothetical protein